LSFYGYDGTGSVRQLTNSSGAITDTYEYDAFGNLLNKTGTTPNNYLYRGEQYDSDLGLYYLRARYYSPITGRFMGRDPLNPQLRDANGIPTDPAYLHKYLYANGDPVSGIDPTGRGDDLVETIFQTGARIAVTVEYTRRIFSLSRCILGIEVLAIKEVSGGLKADLTTTLGSLSLVSGCLSAFFPTLPF
jgi:RHS repeat-associated protein